MILPRIFGRHKYLISILGVVLLWTMIYLPSLGVPDASRNECRRILPAITMINTGNWSVPILDGKPYFAKPPLMNWMIAISFLITGKYTLFSSRVPTTLMILGLAIMLLFMPAKLLTFESRILASCIFLTTMGMVTLGRTANIDPNYVCFTGAAILLWLNAWSNDISGWQRWLPPAIPLSLGILLKGPLILFIYYVFVCSILFTTRKNRELFTFPHILALLLSILPFIAWSYHAKHGLPRDTGYHQAMTKVWIHEILYRFDFNRIGFTKWFRRVLGGAAQFLPWLPVFFLAWNKKILVQLSEKQLAFVKSARTAVVVSFILIALMPVTKARYSLPLLPLIGMVVALLVVKVPGKSGWVRITRKLLSPMAWFALVSTLIFFAAYCLAKFSGVTERIEDITIRKVLNTIASSSFFSVTGPIILAISLFWILRRNRFRLNTAFLLFVFVNVSVGVLLNSFFVLILPPAQALKPRAFIVAKAVDTFYENNGPVYLVKVEEAPFVVLLRQKWHMVDAISSLKRPVRQLVIQKCNLRGLDKYLKKYSLREIASMNISFKSHDYVLLKLGPNK